MKAALLASLIATGALAQAPGAPEETPAIPKQEAPTPPPAAPVPAPAEAAPAPAPEASPEPAPAPALPAGAASVAAAGPGHYQRYDHRGALGLLVATTAERKDAASQNALTDAGWRVGGELGLTYPVSYSGNEFKLSVRGLFGGPVVDTALYLGFRGYFDLSFWRAGLDQWKTFFDLDLCAHLTPSYDLQINTGLAQPETLHAPVNLTGGPRVGVGVQFDFLPVAGAYAALAGQIGFGTGVRFGAELLLGLQFRSYLLE